MLIHNVILKGSFQAQWALVDNALLRCMLTETMTLLFCTEFDDDTWDETFLEGLAGHNETAITEED